MLQNWCIVQQKIYFGTIPSDLAQKIYEETGINVENYNCTLRASEIRKILLGKHGNQETESKYGQRAVTPEDILNIPLVIQSPDSIQLSPKLFQGKPAILFSKTINGRTTVVAYVSKPHMDLTVQTMYSGAKKRSLATTPSEDNLFSQTSETFSGTASKPTIPQPGESVKSRASSSLIDHITDMEYLAAAE
ncbi:MAG: hypothetical protein K6B40_07115, partial [Firmicutes bacterium]|nr:hypothetical protein [Bacillota bacterium]